LCPRQATTIDSSCTSSAGFRKIESAEPQRVLSDFTIGERGQEDDAGWRRKFVDLGQNLDAADIGNEDVEQDNVERLLFSKLVQSRSSSTVSTAYPCVEKKTLSILVVSGSSSTTRIFGSSTNLSSSCAGFPGVASGNRLPLRGARRYYIRRKNHT